MVEKGVDIVILMRDKTKEAISSASAGADKLSDDYEELIESIRKSEETMSKSGNTAKDAASGFGALGKSLAALGGAAMLKQLATRMIEVRSEIQMMEKSFEVLTGSEEAATGMLKELKELAVKSPLEMTDISKAAQTLLSFNISGEKVIPTLKQISDISMGDAQKFNSLTLAFAQMSSTGKLMGQDLMQMINAGFNPLATIAEQTGKSIAELKDEMSEGAISADMVAQAFEDATSEGGKFYNMTEKQAEGLAGLQASMGDAWTNMLNEMGQSQESLIATGYKMTTSLIENYEKIGRALLALLATYGTYKTAVIIATAADKGWTIAQMLHFNALVLVEKAQKALNATMLKNPYVLAASLIVGLVTALWALKDRTTDEEKSLQRVNAELDKYAQKTSERKSRADELITLIKDETSAETEKIKALEELQALYPKIFGNMDLEAVKLADLNSLKKQRNELDVVYQREEYERMITEGEAEIRRLEESSKKATGQRGASQRNKNSHRADEIRLDLAKYREKLSEMDRLEEESQKREADAIAARQQRIADNTPTKAIDALKASIAEYKRNIADLRGGKKPSEDIVKDIETEQKKLDEATKKLEVLTGKDDKKPDADKDKASKVAADALKQEQKVSDELLNLREKNEQSRIELMEDGEAKSIAKIKARYENEIAELERMERDWRAAQKGTLTIEQETELETARVNASERQTNDVAKLYVEQLEQYRTYAERRLKIEKDFQNTVSALRIAGAKKENMQIAEQEHNALLKNLDAEFAAKEESYQQFIKEISKLSMKQLMDLINQMRRQLMTVAPNGDDDSEEAAVLREKIAALKEAMQQLEEANAGKSESRWTELARSINTVSNALAGLGDALNDTELGDMFYSMGNSIGQMFDLMEKKQAGTLSKADAYSAAISGVIELTTLVISATEQRHKVEQEFYRNQISLVHEYALALNETMRMQYDYEGNGFFTDYAEKIKNGFEAMTDAASQYQEALSKLAEGKANVDLKNAVDWGKVGEGAAIGAASGAAIGSVVPLIGTAIGAAVGGIVGGLVGLFGGKKKETVVDGLLEVFPELVDSAGNLNKELAQVLISTEQVDEDTKQLIQNALDWADAIEEANKQIEGVVTELAGNLGTDIKDALVDAFMAGEDASKRMFAAASDSLENFIEDLLYSTIFSETFKKFGEELVASINPVSGDQDIVDDYDRLMKSLSELDDVYLALLESIQNRGNDYGFNLWQDDDANSQTGRAGAFTTMTQDQATKLEGLFTSLQIHTATIDDNVADMASKMYSSLDCLLHIEENTSYCRRLDAIADDIATIKRDGLKVK